MSESVIVVHQPYHLSGISPEEVVGQKFKPKYGHHEIISYDSETRTMVEKFTRDNGEKL